MSQTASAWIVDVNEESFDRLVVQESRRRPVILDFWAPWCGPCRTFSPVIERVVNEKRGEVVLAKVNTDEAQELALHFGVEGIPAIKVVRDGALIFEHTGVLPEAQLRDLVNQLVPSEADRLVQQAAAAEESAPARAEALYRQALELDPRSDAPRVGLARVLVAQKKDDEVLALLEPVAAEGPLGEEAQRLRSQLALRGLSDAVSADEAALRRRVAANPNDAQARYELGCALAQKGRHEEALELLLSAAERDVKLANSKVREAMVQIFYALGQSHPLSDKYRAKLALLLY
jgi:putative thioredoxin